MDYEPEFHAKLIRALEGCQREHDAAKEASSTVTSSYREKELSNAFVFKSIAPETVIPEKKPPKEFVSTEGVLKFNWCEKHYTHLPSVLLFCIPFDVSWNPAEFNRREYAIQDRYARLKQSLQGRDCKIIVIAVRVGVQANYQDANARDVLDERLGILKKHLQLDSKTFYLCSSAELADPLHSASKKIFKSCREIAYAYYASYIKKFKHLEKGVSEKHKGLNECILLARFNFKIAFLNEFVGNKHSVLKYYRACYQVRCCFMLCFLVFSCVLCCSAVYG